VAALLRGAVGALLGALLTACAMAPRAPSQAGVDPAQIERFDLDGRINMRVEKKSYPGRIRWHHAPPHDEMWFYSPVGTTVAHLRQGPDGATLVTSQGREYRAEDLRDLANEVLGWDLPLEALPYWVRGLAWPAEEPSAAERDERGRMRELSQAGWQVTYLDWAQQGRGALPSKLDLLGDRLRMRLVVERWTLGSP